MTSCVPQEFLEWIFSHLQFSSLLRKEIRTLLSTERSMHHPVHHFISCLGPRCQKSEDGTLLIMKLPWLQSTKYRKKREETIATTITTIRPSGTGLLTQHLGSRSRKIGSLRPASDTQWVWGQPGLYELFSKIKNKTTERRGL